MLLKEANIKNFENYSEWVYDVPISEEHAEYINWTMNIARSRDLEADYDIIGSAGRDENDEPSLSITIVLPSNVHQNKVKIKYAELFDVVAHELHHIAQNIDNNEYPRSTNEKGKLSYLLDPFEIEAFHIGIRAQSMLTGNDFEAIARDYIERSCKHLEITKEDVTRVITAWKNTDFPAFRQNTGEFNNV